MPELNFRELLDYRALLEGFGARYAARHVAENPALMDGLNAILERLTKASRRGNYEMFREADRQLHETIMELSCVPGLADAWRVIWEKLAVYHRRSFREITPDPRLFIEDHEYLVNMLATGEPAAAEDAVRTHLEASWMRMTVLAKEPADSPPPLYLAAMYMKAYMQYPLRLGEVAKVACASAGHLTRLFRLHHGLGFKAYLQKLRMEKTAMLLADTGLPIAAIARRAGYRSMPLFAQHFRRHHGRLPRKWRQEKNPRFRPAR